MNQTFHPDSVPDVPWPTSDHRAQLPGTSMLPGSEQAPPAVRQLGDSVAAAEQTLHANAGQLRDTRDAWVDGVRTTVRSNPLMSVAAALALGALVARLSR